MAAWPSTLPDPLNEGMTITSGSTIKLRKAESGRYESRRFGDGMPDRLTCIFRLINQASTTPASANQIDIFNDFFDDDLNQGVNWFTADWITSIGYTSHKARFLGYPKINGTQGYYYDLEATLLIQRSAWCEADTTWT